MKKLFIIIPIIIILLIPIIFLFNKEPLYYKEAVLLSNEIKEYYLNDKENIEKKECTIYLYEIDKQTGNSIYTTIKINNDIYYIEYSSYEEKFEKYYYKDNNEYYCYDAINSINNKIEFEEYSTTFNSINAYRVGFENLNKMSTYINSKMYKKYEYFVGNNKNVSVSSFYNEKTSLNPNAIKFFSFRFVGNLFISGDEEYNGFLKNSSRIEYHSNIKLPNLEK